MRVKKSFHALTGKLILAIGTLMVVGSLLFWLFLFKHQEKELLESSVKYGYSFVDFIRNSTRYAMLTANGTIIQQTVEAIGGAEGIMNVRIFNSTGKVVYAATEAHRHNTRQEFSPVHNMPCRVSPVKDTPSWKIHKGSRTTGC